MGRKTDLETENYNLKLKIDKLRTKLESYRENMDIVLERLESLEEEMKELKKTVDDHEDSLDNLHDNNAFSDLNDRLQKRARLFDEHIEEIHDAIRGAVPRYNPKLTRPNMELADD